MGVPVLLIEAPVINDPNRFEPYDKWLHYVTNDEFLKHGCDFDFENGTPNKSDYLKYRVYLIHSYFLYKKHFC